MELNIRMVLVFLAMLFFLNVNGQVKHHSSMLRDSVMLQTVEVTGKSKTQRLREGALAVNAIDIRSIVSSINSISSIIDQTAGVKIREEGGIGSDFDLSINGMNGSSVRYFIDGVPMDTKGSGLTLANLPVLKSIKALSLPGYVAMHWVVLSISLRSARRTII